MKSLTGVTGFCREITEGRVSKRVALALLEIDLVAKDERAEQARTTFDTRKKLPHQFAHKSQMSQLPQSGYIVML